MKVGELYCAYREGRYFFFFNSELSVRMCGVKKENVKHVEFHETTEDLAEYWGWYEFESENLVFVFEEKFALLMCDPFSFRYDIEAGVGRVVPLTLKEIN